MKIVTPQEWAAKEAARRTAKTTSTTCTKYELVRALRDRFPALLAELRQAYAADPELQFWWSSVLDLDRENADFQTAAAKLGIDAATLDGIFAAIGEA